MLKTIIDIFICGSTGYLTYKSVINKFYGNYIFFNKENKIKQQLTKKEFIENIVYMLEKNIINSKTVLKLLDNKKSDREFKRFSKSFYNKYFCNSIKQEKLGDIPIFRDFIFKVEDGLLNIINDNIEDINSNFFNNINVSEIITKDQIKNISKNCIENISLLLENTNFLNDSLSIINNYLEDYKITDILNKNSIKSINDNIEEYFNNLNIKSIDNVHEELDNVCYRILNIINIDKLVDDYLDNFKNMKVEKLINLSDAKITKAISIKFDNYINSKDFQKFCFVLYDSILQVFNESNITLYDFYENNLNDKVNDYLIKKKNNIMHSCMNWLDKNTNKISDVIHIAVNKYVSTDCELNDILFSSILNYINSKKYGNKSISNLILNNIDKTSGMNHLSKFLSEELKEYLKTTNINNILHTLEEQKIINKENFYINFHSIIKKCRSSIIDCIVRFILDKNLIDIFDRSLINNIKTKLKICVIDIIEENIFFNNKLYKNISKDVVNFINKNKDDKIGELTNSIVGLDTNNDIKEIIKFYLFVNKKDLINKIEVYIEKNIKDINILDLINKSSSIKNNLNKQIIENINTLINKNNINIITKLSNYNVENIIDILLQIPNLNSNSAKYIKEIISDNFAYITEKYVKKEIFKYFNNINEEDYNYFLKRVTNIENKYSAITSSILGGCIGLGASYGSYRYMNQNLFSNIYAWQSVLTCAVTGYFSSYFTCKINTNLNSKNKILNNIPIFRNISNDYLLLKQNEFAKEISTIIDNSILDLQNLQKFIKENEKIIKRNFNDSLKKDNYNKLDRFIVDNSKIFSDEIIKLVYKQIKKNNTKVVDFISNCICDISVKDMIGNDIKDYYVNLINNNKNIQDKIFNDFLIKIFKNERIFSYLPICISTMCNYNIYDYYSNFFNSSINKFTYTSFMDFIFKNKLQKFNDILEKKVSETVFNSSFDKNSSQLFDSIMNVIFCDNNKKMITQKIYTTLRDVINIDQQIDMLINRKSKVIMNGMLYGLFNDIMNKSCSFIEDNIEKISSNSEKDILNTYHIKEKSLLNKYKMNNVISYIVKDIINLDLRDLLTNNFDYFYEISKVFIKDIISINFSDICIEINYKSIDKILNNYVLSKKCVVRNHIYFEYNKLINILKEKKLKEYFNCFNCKNLQDFFTSNNLNIKKLIKDMKISALDYKQAIVHEINYGVDIIYNRVIKQVTFNELFNNINKNDLNIIEKNISIVVKDNDIINAVMDKFIENLNNYYEEIDYLDIFLNKEILKKDIKFILDNIIKNKELVSNTGDTITNIFKNNFFSNYILENDEKSSYLTEYLINQFVEGLYNCTEKSFNRLFKVTNINKDIEEKINKLNYKNYNKIFSIYYKNSRLNIYENIILSITLGLNRIASLSVQLYIFLKKIVKRKKK